jgi:predicted nucleic acid-binding protein
MVVPCASAAGRNDLEQWIGHRGDAQIVADALAADADYIVTLDKAHLLGNTSLPGNIAGRIVSPGDLLSVFRSHERLQ